MEVDRELVFERRLYYGTRFLAQTAQNLFFVGLFVAAGVTSNGAVNLSSLFLAMLLPAILFGFGGGALADRLGPHRGYALGALLRLIAAAAALALVTDARTAWVAAFAYSAGSQVFSPAEMALVHTLRRDAPGQAHSLLIGLQYGGQAVGMLILAPIFYLLGGNQAVLGVAAAGLALVSVLATVLAARLGDTSAGQRRSPIRASSLRETFAFFSHEWRARYAVVSLAMKAIVLRGLLVAVPIYVSRDIGVGREAIVFLVAPGIVGFAAGLVWAGRTVRLADAVPTMRMALLGTVVAVLALAVLDYGLTAVAVYSRVPPIVYLEASMNTTFAVALPAAVLLGLCLGGALVASRVALTETAPAGQQSRVFAVQITLSESLIVLPMLAMGVGTQYAGARVTLAAIGALATLAALALELPRAVGKVSDPVPALPEPSAVSI